MRHSLLTVILAILTASCKNDNTPTIQPMCPTLGIGAAHPYHDQYQELLDKYVDKGFPGIVGLVSNSDGLWVGSSGLADKENNIPLESCHLMYSGSVAKLYTVTLALRLYEEGLLDLDAPISKYLSMELTDNLPNGKSVTVRQLMNHSAGMPDVDDNEALSDYVEAHNGNLPSGLDQLSYIFNTPAKFEPGQGSEYSSTHTLVLAIVIDEILNKHHAHGISEYIIELFSLYNTYYKNEVGYPSPANMTKGYYGVGKHATDISELARNFCNTTHGDAGIIASAGDYYSFMVNLMSGYIIEKSTLAHMLTPSGLSIDPSVDFGLGPILKTKDGDIVRVGHSGVTIGGMAHLYYFPANKSYLVLLTNTLANTSRAYEQWGNALSIASDEISILSEFENLVME